MPGDPDEDPRTLHPISINLSLPRSLIREIERAAHRDNLSPADWVLQTIADKLGFTVEWIEPPPTTMN